jgi:hypothetical protein
MRPNAHRLDLVKGWERTSVALAISTSIWKKPRSIALGWTGSAWIGHLEEDAKEDLAITLSLNRALG